MKRDTTANDPIVSVVCWRGPQSALAARLGIQPTRLAAWIARHGHTIEVQSPTAMIALKRRLAVNPESHDL